MKALDRITARLLALVGLEFDFSIDLRGSPFSRINDCLYVGARPQAEDVDALRDAGITDVVSCLEARAHPEVSYLRDHFEVLFLELRDSIDQDIASAFPAFSAFAGRAAARNAEAKVLVHCEAGVSRSATLATAHLMTTRRLSFFDAFREVRSGRPEVLPNIGFASQLQRLERTLPDVRVDGPHASLTCYLHQFCNVPAEPDLVQQSLEQHGFDAPSALRALFDGEIPRVVQGVRI